MKKDTSCKGRLISMIEEPLSPCHTGIFASNHVEMTTSHRNQPVHLPYFATWFFYLLAWFVGGMCFTAFSETQLTPSENLKTATSPDSISFYLSSQVQVIHLQIHDSDLKKMKSALPQRIYVPATFRWGNQTIENVGVRHDQTSNTNEVFLLSSTNSMKKALFSVCNGLHLIMECSLAACLVNS